MSKPWKTMKVPPKYNYVSPGGASEIRLLPSFDEGEIVHATAVSKKPSAPAMLNGIGEFFYILRGKGELWRATGRVENVVPLHPGRCTSIPPGISFQYRAIGGPLEFLVASAPRWQQENWSEVERRHWNEEGEAVGVDSQSPGPWMTLDLPGDHQYLAPDGSEVRPLVKVDAGGLSHRTLAAGRTSGPVRHQTAKQVWYVIEGRGDVWRSNDFDEEVVAVEPGTALTIPTRVSFQFRANQDGPLKLMIGTFPAWSGASEAEAARGFW